MQSLVKIVGGMGKFTIILSLCLILMIPIIYHFGSYDRYEPDPHPLYNLFDKKQYYDLYNNLVQKDAKKIILTGDFKMGLKHYLDHFANIRTSRGFQVIVNEIYNNDIPIVPYLRQLKSYIEDRIDMEASKTSTWIIIDERQFPAEQLAIIMARHPKDRFIVAVDSKVKLSNNNQFKNYVFEPLSAQQFKSALVSQLKVPAEHIEPLYNYFGGIQGIFDLLDLDQDGLKPQSILRQYFKSISILSNDDKELVQKLCTQGPQKVAPLPKTLKSFGILIFDDTIYWQNELAKLNYELQVGKVCPNEAVATQKILQQIKEQQKINKPDKPGNNPEKPGNKSGNKPGKKGKK